MPRYIDAEALTAEFKRLTLGENSLIERVFADGVYAVIETFPTADVVEVVRCKDCKYLERTDCFGECSLFNDRGEPRGEMLPNDYCSYGKRRT